MCVRVVCSIRSLFLQKKTWQHFIGSIFLLSFFIGMFVIRDNYFHLGDWYIYISHLNHFYFPFPSLFSFPPILGSPSHFHRLYLPVYYHLSFILLFKLFTFLASQIRASILYLTFCDLLHVAIWSQDASVFLKMTQICPSSWLSGIPLSVLYPFIC